MLNPDDKLVILGDGAKYDLSCACGSESPRIRGSDDRWIYPSVLPDGRRAMLLKVLLSNGCERNCGYCAQRLGGMGENVCFKPDELASLFIHLHRAGKIVGLFLSSAVTSGTCVTMDRMIASVEIIRFRYHFRGFIHLKILPGSELAQVERAVQIADRVSINLEVPDQSHLDRIAPQKNMESDILQRMRWIAGFIEKHAGRCRGHTTQFVVGAASESDRKIMNAVQSLYREMKLSRAYFSAFQPVPGTPLDNGKPTLPVREHRLYQSDFLLRKYGFAFDELPFDGNGNFSLQKDPKECWAESHLDFFPLEINKASPEELLRVPGIARISHQDSTAA
jgi:predicted DNA-binding helix-hairpin-helix protein